MNKPPASPGALGGNMRGREARKAKVIEEYNSGMTVREMAEKHGITIDAVRQYLREYKSENANADARKMAAEISERTEAMARELEDGMSMREIAEIHGVSYPTVQQSLQDRVMDGINLDILYKQLTCPAQSRHYISKWTERQAGRTLRTPDGDMLVAEVYPRNGVMVCIVRGNKRTWRTTFTSGQLFYMNGGR